MGYRDYTEDLRNPSFDRVQVPDRGADKLTLDKAQDRIIFSFPFYDSMDVYRGTALFTVSVRAVVERLISAGRIRVGDDITLINTPPGIISGGPETTTSETLTAVSAIWDSGVLGLVPLNIPLRNIPAVGALALVSAKTSQGVFFGNVVSEALFSFPPVMKLILLLIAFLTIFLAVFFLFNIRQDSMTIIRNRLKELQTSLIEQFYETKGEIDWARWTMELEQRRTGVRAELKRGINSGRGAYSAEDVDALIDTAWNELVAFIAAWGKSESGLDEERLRFLLNRVIQSLPQAEPLPQTAPPATDSAAEVPEELIALEPELSMEPELFPEGTLLDETASDDWPLDPDQEEAPYLVEPASTETLSLFADIAKAGNITLLETGADRESMNPVEPAKPEQVSHKAGGLLAAAMKIRLKNTQQVEEVKEVEEFEEAEELEELEDSEEPGELEELEEKPLRAPSRAAQPAKNPGDPERSIKELESMIEFGPNPVSDPGEEAAEIQEEVEIVSPFSSMLSSLDSEDEKKNDPKLTGVRSPDAPPPAPVEEMEFPGMFITSRPFRLAANQMPELLPAARGGLISAAARRAATSRSSAGTVIQERGGVPYINLNFSTLDQDDSPAGQNLNPEFRMLVDSVIKKVSLN